MRREIVRGLGTAALCLGVTIHSGDTLSSAAQVRNTRPATSPLLEAQAILPPDDEDKNKKAKRTK